jgi:hypothetical protein
MGEANLIEVAGPAQDVLARAAELRAQGWTVHVRETRLTKSCEVIWTLEVDREV